MRLNRPRTCLGSLVSIRSVCLSKCNRSTHLTHTCSWWFQSLSFTALWLLAHEASLLPIDCDFTTENQPVRTRVFFTIFTTQRHPGLCSYYTSDYSTPYSENCSQILHSALGTPYYSWKYSHRQHHRFNGHLEKDEQYVPGLNHPPFEKKRSFAQLYTQN